jgi:hypothetical protein
MFEGVRGAEILTCIAAGKGSAPPLFWSPLLAACRSAMVVAAATSALLVALCLWRFFGPAEKLP